ncbi:papain-like cysteine protease family protein [Streptomyces sp. NPDC059917]|uniref:papain-like cysteine protease family protein n=1 Tax=Streptomyces sp. NPDC059917 TaxID=3347002 RepID=UPI00364DD92E
MRKEHTGPRAVRGRHRLAPVLVAALVGAATVAATGAARAAPVRIDIAMRAQEKTNWCWAAAGSTIARQLGADRSQNAFCNAAFDRRQDTECPNDQADLGNVQRALRWAGIAPGKYVTGWLRYSTVKTEIDAGRPVETRVLWTSGGGHMHVVYGYDEAKQWVYWGDPWPSYTRYNWGSHDYYRDNGSFRWTHSLYEIGKG